MSMDAAVFVHEKAIVEPGVVLGRGTRVWAFAHILPGAVIGEDCNICDGVFIESDVVVGDRVTVKLGVQLWDGIRLENDVFVGPNATFTNDPFPRSKHHLTKYVKTIVRVGASIGANATILPGVVVGQHAMVGAGAVVTTNVPPYAIVIGNPARISGYVTTEGQRVGATAHVVRESEPIEATQVPGVALYHLPLIVDMRGSLSVGEYDQHLPFLPVRYFIVFDVPTKEVRGEHAHRTLTQFLVCLKGSCAVVADNGVIRTEITLDRPNLGVLVPPKVWTTQYKFTRDAILLVLASDRYDAEEYIRDYDEFLSFVRSQNPGESLTQQLPYSYE